MSSEAFDAPRTQFSVAVEDALMASGLTQTKFAEFSNVSRRTIGRIIYGEAIPSPQTVAKVIYAIEIDPSRQQELFTSVFPNKADIFIPDDPEHVSFFLDLYPEMVQTGLNPAPTGEAIPRSGYH